MEWLANTDFGQPAKDMNLNYIEYKIGEKDSSLREQYPRDHQVFRDPNAIIKQGWLAFRAVYLDKQDVKLDVRRFRGTLIEAKASASFEVPCNLAR
ncbi:Alpha-1,3-arabinosyltransferase XAT3 [Camellia lanceoleosa]|uniref:Alpha-1,3-arabinosyltransferase XAT3 n=1 Tax=Camellia lanceoleosa TaxID=1840588 RepID=A0ACC0F9L1_9ERIC|nr:Alpha-1,3-arabinosyltransferase XAT3 [Camellia lanceoleosa]